MIWTEVPDEKPIAFLFEGDLSEFNGVYVDECEDETKEDRLGTLMCGEYLNAVTRVLHKDKFIPFPLDIERIAVNANDKLVVIHCGFIL